MVSAQFFMGQSRTGQTMSTNGDARLQRHDSRSAMEKQIVFLLLTDLEGKKHWTGGLVLFQMPCTIFI